jgi:hypothetical protein
LAANTESTARRRLISLLAADEASPTGKFAHAELRALVSRSTLESVALRPQRLSLPSLDQTAPFEAVTRVDPSATIDPGLVLAKGAPVLIMNDAPSAAPRVETEEPQSIVVPVIPMPPALLMAPALTMARASRSTVVSSPRKDARSGYLKRRAIALALLAFVVVLRPWWWNVGDTSAAAKVAVQRLVAQAPSITFVAPSDQ